ncbi:MAG: hypothetical protein ACR2IE_08145 [Candidatus Sumerlaeaceae bacterium]
MNRQEILLNLTLITVIGALGYSIYDARQNRPEISGIRSSEELAVQDTEDISTETTYNRRQADLKFPKVGNTDLFKAIIPPTPSPIPPTPKPTDTPNIHAALNAWKVLSVQDGTATIEDVIKSRAGIEDAVFDMKPGDTRPIDIGGGQTRPVKLDSADEVTNPDQPSATFSMQDTQAVRTLKMGDEAGANAAGKPPEGQPQQAPAPQ